MPARKHCELFLPSGSTTIRRWVTVWDSVLDTKWWSWVFNTQERKKESWNCVHWGNRDSPYGPPNMIFQVRLLMLDMTVTSYPHRNCWIRRILSFKIRNRRFFFASLCPTPSYSGLRPCPNPRARWISIFPRPNVMARWTSIFMHEYVTIPAPLHWLMIAFITWNNHLVPLLEGLCSSNPHRIEFSKNLWGFAEIEPTTSGLTVPRSEKVG